MVYFALVNVLLLFLLVIYLLFYKSQFKSFDYRRIFKLTESFNYFKNEICSVYLIINYKEYINLEDTLKKDYQ